MVSQRHDAGRLNFHPRTISSRDYRLKEATLYQLHLDHIRQFFFPILIKSITAQSQGGMWITHPPHPTTHHPPPQVGSTSDANQWKILKKMSASHGTDSLDGDAFMGREQRAFCLQLGTS